MARLMRRRFGLFSTVGVAASALLLSLGVVPSAAGEPAPEAASGTTSESGQIDFTSWQGPAAWRSGESSGMLALPGERTGMIMTRGVGTVEHTDADGKVADWEYATWTSPLHELDFGATELVASWAASTPGASWISVEMQGTYDDGSTTPWYVLGNWATSDTAILRGSVEGQGDGRSEVLTDTVAVITPNEPNEVEGDSPVPAPDLLSAYRLRVTTYRVPGTLLMPRVWMLGAMASNIPERQELEPSVGGIAWGEQLAVPRRAKSIHPDRFPELGGGHEWSSPAAVTMVMEYFGVVPARADMAWIDAGYTDPQVAHAAKLTWDHTFDGAGNWPFNTAYASSFPELEGFVTRLRSLDDVERLVDAGIPVITSQSFHESELDGAGYGTSGHLMVVTGFTEDGDVVVNDPAARSNASVRRVYDRHQFETVWLRSVRALPGGQAGTGSGGIVYIIKPHHADLPELDYGAW